MALTKISTAMISQSAAAVDLNVDAGTFYVDTTNNRVGVGGKTDPDTPLHVIGTATATTFAGSGASLTDIPNSALTNSSITINSTAVSLGGSLTLTTANIAENTNLYYTDARADARIAAADTDDLSEGSSNLYYTDARVDARVSGGSLGNITTTGYIRGPATFTLDPAAHGDDTGTVVIAGNLQVDGTTTTINSTTLTVDDKNITLASGSANAAAADGAGFTVDIGSGTLPAITYDGTNDEWDFNKPLNVQTNLLISSSASNSIISESGAGGLFLRGSSISVQNSSNANMIQALSAGAVTLYHNGAPKIATSSSGASITGILNVTGNIVVSGTVDGVDIATRDAVLTSTTTTADAALPKAGGTMTGVLTSSSHVQIAGNLDVVGQIGAYDNPGSAWGKMILGATDFEFKNAGGTIVGSIDTSNHFRIINDLQMDSTSPKLDYDNGDSNGSFRLFSTSRNAATHQFYPNGHAHFITTAGTFKIEGLGGSSNQIESSGSLKVRAVSGHVDLIDGTTEVLQTTTTGVTLPLNLVVNGKLGINENSLSSNARLQVRYDNSQSYNAYNALTNPSMIIKNLTSGASKFTSLGFITESNGEGAISLVQGSGNINADMTFSVRSSGTRAEHMRITHDGKVGIGTDAPAYSLDFDVGDTIRLRHTAAGSAIRVGASDYDVNLIRFDGATGITDNGYYGGALRYMGSRSNYNNSLSIFMDNSTGTEVEAMTILQDGNVGIGTDDPDARLGIKSSGASSYPLLIKSSDNHQLFRFREESDTRGTFYINDASENSKVTLASSGNSSFMGGNVGIGTDSPTKKLDVRGAVGGGILTHAVFTGTTNRGAEIRTRSDISGGQHSGCAEFNSADSEGTGGDIALSSNGNVRMFIGGEGNVGIGTSSPTFTAVSGSTNQIGLEIQNGNNDSSAHLKLTGRNNTGTPGQATSFEIVHRGDALKTSFIHGGTEVWEFDSSGHAHLGMNDSDTRLTLGSLGTPNTNSSNNIRSVGTILRNNAGGSTGTHEWEINGALKLQIQSSGVLQTTTTGSGDGYDIIARSTDGGDTGLELTRNGVAGFGIAVRGATTDYADFQLNDGGSPSYTETGKMRLYADGTVSIPGTALWSSSVGNVFGTTGNHYMVRTSSSAGNESMIISNTIGSGGALGVIQYRNGGTVRGDYLIADQTNGIYFNSASDYRFKENVTDIPDGYLNKLTSLRPVTYTHSADMDDDTTTVHSGLIAHEVAEVFPEFVLGEKDAVYTQEDLDAKGDQTTVTESVGDPLYQTVAYSKKEWNVYIIKALQELKAENEALKARLDALEGE